MKVSPVGSVEEELGISHTIGSLSSHQQQLVF